MKRLVGDIVLPGIKYRKPMQRRSLLPRPTQPTMHMPQDQRKQAHRKRRATKRIAVNKAANAGTPIAASKADEEGQGLAFCYRNEDAPPWAGLSHCYGNFLSTQYCFSRSRSLSSMRGRTA